MVSGFSGYVAASASIVAIVWYYLCCVKWKSYEVRFGIFEGVLSVQERTVPPSQGSVITCWSEVDGATLEHHSEGSCKGIKEISGKFWRLLFFFTDA